MANHDVHSDGPARDYVLVTPSDSADLPREARAFYVTVSGNLVLRSAAGNTITIPSVATGVLSLGGVRVLSTGTTATVYALY